MSKSLSAGYLLHVGGGRTTLATALRITRGDGQVFGFTSHDIDDLVGGVLYSSNPGLEVSSVAVAAGTGVGTLELTTFNDGVVFAMSDLFNGVWRNASFLLFRYNYENLAEQIEPILAGVLSELRVQEEKIVGELRDLRQFLQQPVGEASSKTCRYRLGDSRCTKSLASFTYSGTITHAISGEVVRDSARAEAAGWFDEGEIEITSGTSAGVRRKVRSYAANGSFSLAIPIFSTVEVGSTYTAIAGCKKRLEEDCRDKFNNVVNFGGEPHRRGLNDILKAPV